MKELAVHIRKNMSIKHHFRKSYYQTPLMSLLDFDCGHFLFNDTTFNNSSAFGVIEMRRGYRKSGECGVALGLDYSTLTFIICDRKI